MDRSKPNWNQTPYFACRAALLSRWLPSWPCVSGDACRVSGPSLLLAESSLWQERHYQVVEKQQRHAEPALQVESTSARAASQAVHHLFAWARVLPSLSMPCVWRLHVCCLVTLHGHLQALGLFGGRKHLRACVALCVALCDALVMPLLPGHP